LNSTSAILSEKQKPPNISPEATFKNGILYHKPISNLKMAIEPNTKYLDKINFEGVGGTKVYTELTQQEKYQFGDER
jgi:hypothetical protein